MQRASETINKPLEAEAKTTYSYMCPSDMFLDGKDINYDISYERRKDDEQWCYTVPASGGERG